MTEEEVIAALNSLTGHDPEVDHARADELLLKIVSPAVRDAYEAAEDRAGAWWYA